MTGEGLEPSTNGLTYLIGFHRPPVPDRVASRGDSQHGVEGLDYPIAIAGVPRLVSGAGAGRSAGPLPADYPIPRLFRPSRLPLPATLWCGGSQGVPAYCGIHSSRFGFFPREAPVRLSCVLKSVALPTELPGLETRRLS